MYFGIPVASKRVLADWDHSTKLLEGTLRSILNQTDPELKVLIACHEVPEVSMGDDPRLEFIPVDFPPPIFNNEWMVDKHRKREIIGARLRELGGGYLMYVDSDDLVSNKLVAFVHQDRAPYGYVIDKGYELDYNRRKIRTCPRLHFLSGSCAIVKCEVADLPQHPLAQEGSPFRKLLNTNHPRWPDYLAGLGRPLQPVPFRAVVYLWNHGANMSALLGNVGPRRALLRLLQRGRTPGPAVVEEFGISF